MKKSFILYYDQYKTISLLSQEEKWELLDAIYQSHNWWIEFEMTPKVELVFSMLEWQFQRDWEKRDNIREARSKAWSKWWQKTQSKAKSSKIKQNQANEAVNDNVTVTVTVTDNVINKNNVSFSEFWSAYPHFRKWKKPDAKQHYEKSKLTHEEIMQEVKILKRKNHTEISKVQFNPWCHLRIRDITKTSEVVLTQTLKEIVKIMKPQQIFVKNKELMDDFPDIDIKWMFRALDDDKLLKSIKAML